jgi:exopolysaccharide biosynthesis polyprenyl glycosylphosphotransferase
MPMGRNGRRMSSELADHVDTPTMSADPGAWTPSLRYERECRRTAASLMLGDIIVFTGIAMALFASNHLFAFPSGGFALRSGLLFAAISPFVFGLFGLYGFKALTVSALDEARALAAALASMTLLWLFVGLLVKPGSFGRPEALAMVAWLALAFWTALAVRAFIRARTRRMRPERVLIYGAGNTGQTLAERIRGLGQGIEVVGFVDDDPMPLRPGLTDIPVMPETQGITAAIRETDATRLVLAFSQSPTHQVLEGVRTSEFGRLPISIVPRYFEITPAHSTLSEINGFPLLDLRSAQLSTGARAVKRALDLTVSVAAVVALAPLFLLVAAAVKIDSRGPVFFRQERLGSNERPFRIWKFRTMIPDAEARRMEMAHLNEMEGSGPLFKMKNDPRVTRVGRFLRKTSIDELPQLFNVVAGQMSLVGPRPFVTHEAVQIGGWGRKRLDIKPGITGLWQVRGRNDVPFEEMVRLDYMYVTNWSVWWDIRLILQTVPRVLRGSGAS